MGISRKMDLKFEEPQKDMDSPRGESGILREEMNLKFELIESKIGEKTARRIVTPGRKIEAVKHTLIQEPPCRYRRAEKSKIAEMKICRGLSRGFNPGQLFLCGKTYRWIINTL
ncbi:hypothetical protein [Christensenella tenuis]|uniref:Uncharacterized protein n=1 Tax=Christensenella tenuis TaxID=2763033 RepID=A0ABR7EGQ8_9FIRM|nr:hypothetical protein [Christensenella tenuis]MBC5648947.1 hypothetical protein [Christensenella tenuis]